MELENIPENIKRLIDGKEFRTDGIGRSGSGVLIFDDLVLKIVQYRRENEEAVHMMRWLEGKLPVPTVVCFERDHKHQYLLMSKTPGKMSCDDYYMEHPDELIALMAEGLKMFRSVDISGCPRDMNVGVLLKTARYRVENHLVDPEDALPGTFGKDGFKDPQALLTWLEEHKPETEPVLSHGDFCLPNIFINDGKISGFIDLADTGISDKWRDIAICYRSLKHNFDGTYGGKVYPDFDPDKLFDVLGLQPDREKLKYFILLDELF